MKIESFTLDCFIFEVLGQYWWKISVGDISFDQWLVLMDGVVRKNTIEKNNV
jgi:hypothetical protein